MADPGEIRVQDEQGNIHVFPPEATPEMIAQAMNVKLPSASQPSAASRLGTNFLSGLGVTSNEAAKNFFAHPLDTVIKSFEAQGELAKQARDAYNKGDYVGALQHGLNYLVPFLGQQTDQAGTQLKQGDIAGGIGRTLGAAVPIVAGSPEARAVPGQALDAASGAVKSAAPYVTPVAKFGAKALDIATFNRISKLWDAWKGMADEIKAKGPQFANPGAPLPEAPPPELLQARSLLNGGQIPEREAAAALETIPQRYNPNPSLTSPSRTLPGMNNPEVVRPPATPLPTRTGLQLTGEVAAPPPTGPLAATPSGAGLPRTLSGESALRQVLTGQDNASLLKIAKARGINVARESQLKPGVADNLIVNKIIDDFSPDELSEVRAQYLENTRFRHVFGDIGPEAWKTMSLQTYFPDLKIPMSRLARTAKAVAAPTPGNSLSPQSPPPSAGGDLTQILQESLRKAREAKNAQAQ